MSEWISVLDDCPRDGVEVLVSTKSEVWIAFISGKYWMCDTGICHVTHWMELPEPPK